MAHKSHHRPFAKVHALILMFISLQQLCMYHVLYTTHWHTHSIKIAF